MNPHQKYDDEILVSKFYQSRDNYWLGILLERYTLLLLGVCMKYLKNENDAKDAVQQVFYKVLNEFPKSNVSSFKAWIYTVAKNYCLMKMRAEKNIILEEWKDDLSEWLQDETPQTSIEKEQRFRFIEMAMMKLSKEQRTCISLFYVDKKSYAEIAEMLVVAETQVKSHIQNGKRNLKIFIEKMNRENDE